MSPIVLRFVRMLPDAIISIEFYSWFFAGGARTLGRGFWKFGDVKIIDGFFVNGSARVVVWAATLIRQFQSGYIYHYAFTMIVGVFVLLSFWLY